jgi:hypothetical protein
VKKVDVAANNKNETKMENKRHNVEGKKNFITQAMNYFFSGKFLNLLFDKKSIFNGIFILSVLYILAYRVDNIRIIFKEVSIYLITYFPLKFLTIEELNRLALFLEGIIKWYPVLYMVYRLVIYIIKRKNDENVKKVFSEDMRHSITDSTGTNAIKDIDKVIYEYINSDYEHSLLITGDWATGKTYYVNDFLNKFYKHTNKKIYKVSCFGLDARDALAEEIAHVMKVEDDSIYSQFTDIVANIPIIGGVINSYMSKSYSYQKLDKKSIIVFDDLERVAIDIDYLFEKRNITKPKKIEKIGTSVEYERMKLMQEGNISVNELTEIVYRNGINSIYNKYTAILGMINNLTEIYGVKVIIICNTMVLNNKFVKDVIKDKLRCHEYHLDITKESYMGVIKNIRNMTSFQDSEKDKLLKKYLDNIISYSTDNQAARSATIKVFEQFGNLRQFSFFIESFVEMIKLTDTKYLNDNVFMDSLFNSIMIANMEDNDLRDMAYKYFISSANLIFNIRLVIDKNMCDSDCMKKNICDMIKIHLYTSESTDIADLRWMGREIAYNWNKNLNNDKNKVNQCIEKWKKYEYGDLEKNLLINNFKIIKDNNMHYYHMLCLAKYNYYNSNYSLPFGMVISSEEDDKKYQEAKKKEDEEKNIIINKLKEDLEGEIDDLYNDDDNLQEKVLKYIEILFEKDSYVNKEISSKVNHCFEQILKPTNI